MLAVSVGQGHELGAGVKADGRAAPQHHHGGGAAAGSVYSLPARSSSPVRSARPRLAAAQLPCTLR